MEYAMKHIVTATLTVSALLLAVVPAIGGGGVAGMGGHGTRVLVAPQQTVVVSPQEAVITPRPFLVVQREAFVPAGVVVPGTFAAFRGFHHRFGHVIVFVDPRTGLVWPSGFWAWSGTAWVWIPQ
jgi:hypothetical protein